MSIRSLLMLVVGLAIVAFVASNWGLITQPADLSLLVTTIKAPLGLVLLGLMVVLAVLFVAVIAYAQTSMLMEGRRHGKELAAQRELANKAEASRFVELKTFIADELVRLSKERADIAQHLQTRVDTLQAEMLKRIDEQSNSLAAAIGELEDHLRGNAARTGGSS
ncbi:MAG TPA: LapA family protein [Rhodoferax sp.]|jgi:mannitol-specific phosphotransferase system IIBC component|nr:LapA family protein [Rhodoferax sp.]